MPSAYALGNIVFASLGYTIFIQDGGNLTMTLGIIGTGLPPPIVQALLLNGAFDIRPATVQLTSYIWQAIPGPIFMLDAPIGSTHFAGLDSGAFAIVTTP